MKLRDDLHIGWTKEATKQGPAPLRHSNALSGSRGFCPKLAAISEWESSPVSTKTGLENSNQLVSLTIPFGRRRNWLRYSVAQKLRKNSSRGKVVPCWGINKYRRSYKMLNSSINAGLSLKTYFCGTRLWNTKEWKLRDSFVRNLQFPFSAAVQHVFSQHLAW